MLRVFYRRRVVQPRVRRSKSDFLLSFGVWCCFIRSRYTTVDLTVYILIILLYHQYISSDHSSTYIRYQYILLLYRIHDYVFCVCVNEFELFVPSVLLVTANKSTYYIIVMCSSRHERWCGCCHPAFVESTPPPFNVPVCKQY